MGRDPAFLFYPGDYLRDTQNFSTATQVAYDRIMCEHMRNICITQQQVKFFTKRLSDDEKEELMMVLTKIKGGLQIDWVAESIAKRRSYSESRRKNRAKKEENTSKTYDPHMENEIEIEDESINGNKEGILKGKPDNYFTLIKDRWFEGYKKAKDTNPTFGAAEGSTLKSLINKLKTKHREKEIEWTPESAITSFEGICKSALENKWLGEHFTLKNINSQFDIIYGKAIKQYETPEEAAKRILNNGDSS